MKHRHPFNVFCPNWREALIESDIHRFFVLLWKELYNPSTLDAWQPRATNLRSLLQEVVYISQLVHSVPSAIHHLHHLIKEIQVAVTQDHTFAEDHALAARTIIRLNKCVDNPALAGRLSRTILGNMSGYRVTIARRLREELADPTSKRKEAVERLARSLATALVSRGYSPVGLFAAGEVLVDASKGHFLSRFDSLLSEFNGQPRRFQCIMAYTSTVEIAEFLPLQSLLVPFDPTCEPRSAAHEAFYRSTIGGTVRYVKADVTSLDAFGAAQKAELPMQAFLDAAKLVFSNRRICIKHGILTIRDDGTPRAIHNSGRSAADFPSMAPDPKLIQCTMRSLARLRPRGRDQLHAALRYVRLGVMETSSDNRLVMFWVAMEAIVRDFSSSIIESVCQVVPPCFALDRCRRHIRALAAMLNSYYSNSSSACPNCLCDGGSGIDPKRLLALLLKSPTHDDAKSVYASLTEHPLLRHRLFTTHDKFLLNPDSFATGMERSYANAEWQLRRAYRIRNDIVHFGRSHLPSKAIESHIHGYVVSLLSAVASDVSRVSHWQILDALQHRRTIYDELIQMLRANDGSQIPHQALYDPGRGITRTANGGAWLNCTTDRAAIDATKS